MRGGYLFMQVVIDCLTLHPFFRSALRVFARSLFSDSFLRFKSVFFYIITQRCFFLYHLRLGLVNINFFDFDATAWVTDWTSWTASSPFATVTSSASIRVTSLHFFVTLSSGINTNFTWRVWSVDSLDLWNFVCVSCLAVDWSVSAWTVAWRLSRTTAPLVRVHHRRSAIYDRRTGLCGLVKVWWHGVTRCRFVVSCF